MPHFGVRLCQSLRQDARAALLFCSWNFSPMSRTEEIEALWNLISRSDCYAGIGSRLTPEPILSFIESLAGRLHRPIPFGITLDGFHL